MSRPAVSVIIPAFRERGELARLLESLSAEKEAEAIVSVPEGDRETEAVARAKGAKIVRGPAGRGPQLRAGAEAARGDVFLFCHADTLLPRGWKELVLRAVADPRVSAGAFRLRVDSNRPSLRAVAFLANVRSEVFGLPYGDQAFFMRSAVYRDSGGFNPLPLMEDVDFARRLKKTGQFVILADRVATSARRWEKEGVFLCTARNAVLVTLYLLGVPPEKLARWRR